MKIVLVVGLGILVLSVASGGCGRKAPEQSVSAVATPAPTSMGTETATASGSATERAALSATATATANETATAAAMETASTGAAGANGTSTEPMTSGVAAPTAAAPLNMLLVPGGPFVMGADAGGQEDEHPAHTVTLSAFYLDQTEVTNSQWGECVAAKACRPKSDMVRSQHPDFDGPNQPVTGISWDDARAYCEWRGKRLPREAEFERAVRDSDDRRFPWGNDTPTHDKTVFSGARPEDVGTHPNGRGPYGHDDLAGNVWEWMEDEYDPFAYRRPSAALGRPGSCTEIQAALDELRREHKQGFTGSNPIPEECEHSIRGGAYNYDADGLRATNRVHHPGKFRIPMLGVRCATDAIPRGTQPQERNFPPATADGGK